MSDRVSLQNIRLGIADIYLNNKQIGVIQRVELCFRYQISG